MWKKSQSTVRTLTVMVNLANAHRTTSKTDIYMKVNNMNQLI